MKATDICIGDWVICNHYQDKPFIKQFGIADFAKGEYEFCEPIPLTEDILEKNSIKISSFTGTLYWFDEDEHCCVKPIENRFMFMYSKGADYLTFRITYVHELQHMLRLVGIDKEIEL